MEYCAAGRFPSVWTQGQQRRWGLRPPLVSCPWCPSMLWFSLGAKLPHGPASSLFYPFPGSCLLGWEAAEAVLVMQGGHGTGIPVLWAACSYFTLMWLHIILHMQGCVVCKPMACARVVFFIQEDTNSCCITKDTSPMPDSWMVGLNDLFQP